MQYVSLHFPDLDPQHHRQRLQQCSITMHLQYYHVSGVQSQPKAVQMHLRRAAGHPDPQAQLLRLRAYLTEAAEGSAAEGAILPADAQLLHSRVGTLIGSAHKAMEPPEHGRGLLGSEVGRRMKAELRAFVDVHQSHQF